MKKIIDLLKQVFGFAKTVTPEQKQEIEKISENVVKALDEVKAKRGVSPKALAPVVPVVTETVAEPAAKAPAKKKRKYYKPKQPKA